MHRSTVMSYEIQLVQRHAVPYKSQHMQGSQHARAPNVPSRGLEGTRLNIPFASYVGIIHAQPHSAVLDNSCSRCVPYGGSSERRRILSIPASPIPRQCILEKATRVSDLHHQARYTAFTYSPARGLSCPL